MSARDKTGQSMTHVQPPLDQYCIFECHNAQPSNWNHEYDGHWFGKYMRRTDSTFSEVADNWSEIVGLLLTSLTHTDDVSQITPHVTQQSRATSHLSLEESEQRVLDILSSPLENVYRLQGVGRWVLIVDCTRALGKMATTDEVTYLRDCEEPLGCSCVQCMHPSRTPVTKWLPTSGGLSPVGGGGGTVKRGSIRLLYNSRWRWSWHWGQVIIIIQSLHLEQTSDHSHTWVCVCVCERERERTQWTQVQSTNCN